MTLENVLVPLHEKVFIDSVVRNTSIAMRDNVDDSDDESDDESDDSAANDESGNESGSDVYFESDDSCASSIDDSDDVYEVLPELQHLNIHFPRT